MARCGVWALALAAAAAGCGGSATDAPTVESSTPPHGPLVGGTRITLTGTGFTSGGAAPNRVLIAGREAPLVATVDDSTLEVVIPPGEQPGDAELVVLNHNGNAQVTGIFHYSTPPTITAVAPATALYTGSQTITVTGTGFLDEDAGTVSVGLDGQLLADVEVTSDTTLTFTAPPGRPLVQPDIELVDDRGRATRPRAFRYVPSTRGGLLLFPHFGSFAVFFDPVDRTSITIPWVVPASTRFTAVVRDEHGDYWAADRNGRFGRIDMKNQRLESPIFVPGWFPAMTKVGSTYYVLERGTLRFGTFDPRTADFTPLGTSTLPCCGSYGLASNGTLYVTSREGATITITPIDPITGATGTPVPITAPAGLHIEDMRFFAGTLYAANRNGTLVTINPTTGATTVLPVNLGRFAAMEVFE